MIISEMQSKLAQWACEDNTKRFDKMLRLIAGSTWLAAAAEKTLQSKGASTPGIDGVDKRLFKQSLEERLLVLRAELLAGSYKPQPVRRIYIPKANGKKRPIGIPTLNDRIVQRALLMAMEPIWESDFHRSSFGFRPGRSVHHAIHMATWALTDTHSGKHTKGRWVIEGDLASYFDTVHHKILMRCIKKRIKDKRFLRLLWQILKAGQVHRNVFQASKLGVPQGGVISPLLSNIVLHELDSYLERQYLGKKARNHIRGWNESVKQQTAIAVREARQPKPTLSYVRYADDFIAIVKGTQKQATAIKKELQQFLEGELKLTLNMEKTQITHVNDGFEFLGYRLIRKRGGRGQMRPVTGIPYSKYNRLARELSKLLSSHHNANKVERIWEINRKIQGWCEFYSYATYKAKVFQKLDTLLFWKTAHWLGRKYRTSIPKLMRRWYKRPKRGGSKTWILYEVKEGKKRTAQLRKCAGQLQRRLKWPEQGNPYWDPASTTAAHYCYSEIATMTST